MTITATVKAHHTQLVAWYDLPIELQRDFDYLVDPDELAFSYRFAVWQAPDGTDRAIDVFDMFESGPKSDIGRQWFHTFQSDSFFSGYGVNFHSWGEWDYSECEDDCVSVTLVMV